MNSRRSRRHAIGSTALVWMTISLSELPALGEIVCDGVRVGYPATTGAVVRVGSWTPVVVDLSLQNQPAFDGVLRLGQLDRDGDVYVDSVPVHLLAESGSQRRFWLYTVANPAPSRRGFQIELLTTKDDGMSGESRVDVIFGGRKVPLITPADAPQVVPDDEYLILAVSEGSLGKIRQLLEPEESEKFDRRVNIAHVSPSDLPGTWIGLEMVDSIVWDECDPTKLTDAQEQAIVDWVGEGGKLVLAAARTSDAVARADLLGALMPVKVGTVHSVTHLPQVRHRLLGIDQQFPNFEHSFAAVSCEAVEDPDVKVMLDDEGLGGPAVASRRVGKGQVVFVAAALEDLLADAQALPAVFFARLLELRANRVRDEDVAYSLRPLFPYFDGEVGFYRSGSARLALAITFATAYVLLATVGAWRLLQSRGLLRHSWTAMAVIAAGASALSVVGVQAMHGVGWEVHQLTVVDGVAGSVEGQATAYFGLTTGTVSTMDVWLPDDHLLSDAPTRTTCNLRPMLDWRQATDALVGYTDPASYQLRPATAEIHGVPVRATLKQFEGRWRGQLRGTLAASLATMTVQVPSSEGDDATHEDYVLSQASWLQNDLGFDLENCFLLVAERDKFEPQVFSEFERKELIRVHSLGTLRHGQRIELFKRLYLDAAGAVRPLDDRNQWKLSAAQLRFGEHFAVVSDDVATGLVDWSMTDYRLTDEYQKVALLLTVLSDTDPVSFKSSWSVPVFSRMRCRQLELSDRLSRGTAILVGFSDEPGPVRLAARRGSRMYDTIDPARARTVYRFAIPIRAPS